MAKYGTNPHSKSFFQGVNLLRKICSKEGVSLLRKSLFNRGSICSENKGVSLLRKGRGQFAPKEGGQFDRILQLTPPLGKGDEINRRLYGLVNSTLTLYPLASGQTKSPHHPISTSTSSSLKPRKQHPKLYPNLPYLLR